MKECHTYSAAFSKWDFWHIPGLWAILTPTKHPSTKHSKNTHFLFSKNPLQGCPNYSPWVMCSTCSHSLNTLKIKQNLKFHYWKKKKAKISQHITSTSAFSLNCSNLQSPPYSPTSWVLKGVWTKKSTEAPNKKNDASVLGMQVLPYCTCTL